MKPLVYLDACIVIYLVEKHEIYAPLIIEYLRQSQGKTLAVSPLLRLEVLSKPLQQKNKPLVHEYESFLDQQVMLTIPEAIYDEALKLRVQSRLKTPDALHLAIAKYHACSEFWTNDKRLSKAADTIAINILEASK